jgi:monothiol glutaredoxin
VTAVDVLPDPQIRAELTALSGWPTIPQVFIGGELVGGADITEELYESGELARKVAEKLGTGTPAGERVIELAGGGNPFRVV